MKRLSWLVVFIFFFLQVWLDVVQPSPNSTKSGIPKTWDDAEMAALEIPLANPLGIA